MSVDSINHNLVANVVSTTNTNKVSDDIKKKEVETVKEYVQDNDTAAVYEKNSKGESVYDEKTIQDMLAESNLKADNFKKLIESILNKQSEKFFTAFPKEIINEESLKGKLKDFFANLEVDEETKLQAQEDISEDGYYGVKKTSERIVNFAKALAGNDPEKLETMYEAVKSGFKAAQEMWGDDLPEICSETFKAVEEGFDAWRKEINGESAEDVESSEKTDKVKEPKEEKDHKEVKEPKHPKEAKEA